jgi:NAD(P)-dependent dehydrogenase (short-subunit alcohol dehydrogenase family)
VRATVLGGSGAIGGAVCARLTSDGHSTIVIDRVPPRAELPFIACDASMAGNAYLAMKKATSRFGQSDALVNCIGLYLVRDLSSFSWEEFSLYVQVNLRAPVEAILAWLEERRNDIRGVVVNVSSAAASAGSRDLSYSASKAALNGVTKSLAVSLDARNVSVFGVAPGIIDTPMSRQMPLKRREEHMRRTIPGRAGTAEEVADLVVFLTTGSTSYMTGAIIPIDGGVTRG